MSVHFKSETVLSHVADTRKLKVWTCVQTCSLCPYIWSLKLLEPVPNIYTSEVWNCVETRSWYLYIWSLKVCWNTFLIFIHLCHWKRVETRSSYLYIWGLKLCWNMFQYIWSLKVCLNTFLISMLQKSETALKCVQLTLCCPAHMHGNLWWRT